MSVKLLPEPNSPEGLINRLRSISTSTLSDVLDKHGIDGVLSGITRRSGSGRSVGRARTVGCTTGTYGDFSDKDFAVFPIFGATEADEMLMMDLAGAETSTFGGLAALTLARQAAAGVVIDGACRDLNELRAINLTVASRFVTPRSGRGRMAILSQGTPISCGGVMVTPGDFVVVDDTGVVVIPAVHAAEVIRNAEEIEARDHTAANKIQAREPEGETQNHEGSVLNLS